MQTFKAFIWGQYKNITQAKLYPSMTIVPADSHEEAWIDNQSETSYLHMWSQMVTIIHECAQQAYETEK